MQAGPPQRDDRMDVTRPFLSSEPFETSRADIVLVASTAAIRQMRELERHQDASTTSAEPSPVPSPKNYMHPPLCAPSACIAASLTIFTGASKAVS